MTGRMKTQFGMRSLAILGSALAATQMSLAQEVPTRISWAPSYSGSCIDCPLAGQNLSGWKLSVANYPVADPTFAGFRVTIRISTVPLRKAQICDTPISVAPHLRMPF